MIDEKIKDEKVQQNINREAAKITAFLSGNMNILRWWHFTLWSKSNDRTG